MKIEWWSFFLLQNYISGFYFWENLFGWCWEGTSGVWHALMAFKEDINSIRKAEILWTGQIITEISLRLPQTEKYEILIKTWREFYENVKSDRNFAKYLIFEDFCVLCNKTREMLRNTLGCINGHSRDLKAFQYLF